MSEHSYARQVLAQNKVLINTGKTVIGQREEVVQTVPRQVPYFETGTKFFDEENIIEIKDYSELRTLGYVIQSISIPGTGLLNKGFGGQRVNYVIVRETMANNPKAAIPRDHTIQYDQKEGRLRLIGKNAGRNGAGEWVYLKTVTKREREINTPRDYSEKSEHIRDSFMSRLTGLPPAPRRVYLKELPVMITEQNEIVCIEQGNDEPTMGFFGQKGSGKTLGLHAVTDMGFHHPAWRRKVGILNDIQAEDETWCLPNNYNHHLVILERLGLSPKPLPVVYLHPHIAENYETVYENDVGFNVSLPYADIVRKFSEFFNLGESEKYFKTHMDEIINCKNEDELFAILDASQKMEKGTKMKIRATLGQLYKLQITDANSGAPSKWKVTRDGRERSFNPVTACLYAGVVPCLRTSIIDAKDFYPQYFKLLAEDIYYRQNEDTEFKIRGERIWLAVDEILSAAEKGKKTPASDILTLCFTQGRIRRIGMLIATQNFNRLPDRIKANLQYLFFFMNPTEAGDIVRTYQLPKHFKNRIAGLRKFECVAHTTHKFIVYDMDGHRREDRGPFVGIMIPPMSRHKPPQKKKDEEGE